MGQFNMRIKESDAQAFRAFCIERGITQSEGLRLLLLTEDFEKRSLLIDEFQHELDKRDSEIANLKDILREATGLQKERHSEILRKRREWVNIAQEILHYTMDRSVIVHEDPELIKRPLRLKNTDGKKMFHSYHYPEHGGCLEVLIEGHVWGLQNKKVSPDQVTPIFICCKLSDGKPVKYRWYPKKNFIGVPPTSEAVSQWGTSWLLGGISSQDGAMDVVCALPLNAVKRPNLSLLNIDTALALNDDFDLDDTFPALPTPKKPSGLDAVILGAERRTKK